MFLMVPLAGVVSEVERPLYTPSEKVVVKVTDEEGIDRLRMDVVPAHPGNPFCQPCEGFQRKGSRLPGRV